MNTNINVFTLSNGLTVVYIPKLNSSNISFSLRVIAGSMYENSDEIGIAHFLEHIVLDGTKKYPNKRLLSGLIDEKGGIRNASTNQETIEFTVKILKEDIEIAFEYLSQITIYPQISNDDIEKEKKIIEQEINRFKSDPEKFSSRLIYSLLFPDTRLGMLNTGDINDLKRITREKILNYHKKTHCAKNMILSVCGDIKVEELRKITEKYFGILESGNKLPSISIDVRHIDEPVITNLPNLEQATLILGYTSFKVNKLESYAFDLILKILFAGSSSRIRYEIRERKALAYAINSNFYYGRNYGIFTIQIGLSKNKINECLNIIQTELNKISSEIINTNELTKAFAFIKSNYLFNFENSLSLASFYSNFWCSTGEILSIEEILSRYERISKDQTFIQKIAKYIFSNLPAILVLGSDIPENTFAVQK